MHDTFDDVFSFAATSARLETAETLRNAANAALSAELGRCLLEATRVALLREVLDCWTVAMDRDPYLRGHLPLNLYWRLHKELGLSCKDTVSP